MKRQQIVILVAVPVLVMLLVFLFSAKRGVKQNVSRPVVSFREAEAALEQGDILSARALYSQAMENSTSPEEFRRAQARLEEININILFSPAIDDCSQLYEVKPGDTLSKIAKKFGTNVALIKRANALGGDIIRSGQSLKLNTCKFSIVVDKSQNLLLLKRNDEVVKTYVVSTGKNNSTPVGTFKIVNKLANPTWFKTGAVIDPDSPENILGTRWMGFDIKGYGIHGTTEPQFLGTQITLGCVRMRNQEVEELYDIVPVGTEVIIVD